MAKSMRSKFKRKMRALKREKYSARDLEKLRKTTARIQLPVPGGDEVYIKKEPDVLDATTRGEAENVSTPVGDLDGVPDDSVMEVDELKAKDKTKFRLNQKTLKNEHGNYPLWMNQRKMKHLKRCTKRKTREQSSKVGTKPKSGISKKKK